MQGSKIYLSNDTVSRRRLLAMSQFFFSNKFFTNYKIDGGVSVAEAQGRKTFEILHSLHFFIVFNFFYLTIYYCFVLIS